MSETKSDVEQKFCKTCQTQQALTLFRMVTCKGWGGKSYTYPAHQCKACDRARSHKQYAASRQYLLACMEEQDMKCAECSCVCILMEFAHFKRADKRKPDGKCKAAFSRMTVPQMKKERPLGRFLCLLCHFKETQRENKELPLSGRRQAAYSRAYNQKYKARALEHVNRRKREEFKACMDCGWVCTPGLESFLEFDHRPGTSKAPGGVCGLVNRASPIEKLDEEIANCDSVCRICHRLRTNKRALERGPSYLAYIARNTKSCSPSASCVKKESKPGVDDC